MRKHLSILLALFSGKVAAREIYFGSEVEQVTVAAGGATIFRFHEPVKTISQASRFVIKPADQEAPDYAMLSVTPRFSSGSSNVTFILAGGGTVNVKLTVISREMPGKSDSLYDFKPREMLIEKDASAGSNISEMDLLKAMIRLDHAAGYTSQSMNQQVRTGIDGLSAKLVQVYSGPKYQGFIFKLENRAKDRRFDLDLESLILGRPNTAIMSQSDQKSLGPRGSENGTTYLRIVAKPSASFSNIQLPVTRKVEK